MKVILIDLIKMYKKVMYKSISLQVEVFQLRASSFKLRLFRVRNLMDHKFQ